MEIQKGHMVFYSDNIMKSTQKRPEKTVIVYLALLVLFLNAMSDTSSRRNFSVDNKLLLVYHNCLFVQYWNTKGIFKNTVIKQKRIQTGKFKNFF